MIDLLKKIDAWVIDGPSQFLVDKGASKYNINKQTISTAFNAFTLVSEFKVDYLVAHDHGALLSIYCVINIFFCSIIQKIIARDKNKNANIYLMPETRFRDQTFRLYNLTVILLPVIMMAVHGDYLVQFITFLAFLASVLSLSTLACRKGPPYEPRKQKASSYDSSLAWGS